MIDKISQSIIDTNNRAIAELERIAKSFDAHNAPTQAAKTRRRIAKLLAENERLSNERHKDY